MSRGWLPVAAAAGVEQPLPLSVGSSTASALVLITKSVKTAAGQHDASRRPQTRPRWEPRCIENVEQKSEGPKTF